MIRVSHIVLFLSQVIIYQSAVANFANIIFTSIYDTYFPIKPILWSEIGRSFPIIILRTTSAGKLGEEHLDAVDFEAEMNALHQKTPNKPYNKQNLSKAHTCLEYFFQAPRSVSSVLYLNLTVQLGFVLSTSHNQ